MTGYPSTHSEPRRILLVCHYYAPHVGGIETVVQAEAERLAARGHEVVVLTSAARGGESVENGVRVVRVAAWNGLEERLGVPFPVFSPRIVIRAIRLARWSDVIHVHDCFYLSSWSAGLGSLLTRTPMVLSQHVAMVDHPSFGVRAVQKVVYGTVGRALARRARRVFVINEYVRRFVTGLGAAPAKVVVLSNGVDGERFRPPVDAAERSKLRAAYGLPVDERPLALFVGRLVPKKGIDIAVEALDGVADLVTVGSGDPSAVTRSGVYHLGALRPEQVAEVYRCCDLLVAPTTGEVFTLVLKEAMSTGMPVVTTDEPDYATLGVDREGMALVPRRADAVREAVSELLADPARRGRMGAYGIEYAGEHFSWTEHLDLLTSHYRDVAVGGGADGKQDGSP